jgi:hypothetical protein
LHLAGLSGTFEEAATGFAALENILMPKCFGKLAMMSIL